MLHPYAEFMQDMVAGAVDEGVSNKREDMKVTYYVYDKWIPCASGKHKVSAEYFK